MTYAVRNLPGEVACLAIVVFVEPDTRSRAKPSIERAFQLLNEPVDPVPVIPMGIADEDVVLKPRNVGHGQRRILPLGQGTASRTTRCAPICGFAGSP